MAYYTTASAAPVAGSYLGGYPSMAAPSIATGGYFGQQVFAPTIASTFPAAGFAFAAPLSEKEQLQAAWDNHFSAFGEQDIEKILVDYTDASVISVVETSTGEKKDYNGLSGVREFFTGLFERLSDLSALKAPVIELTDLPKHVFLVWECPSSGITKATDTFIFDANNKIIRQNIVVV
eukprot:NODE_1991_length_679_cov_76.177536_g1941_i0.p1 GENE.NODE_1991_length_679_cov_76.177536_g1941_i0~~NODE_1991_length_679_cov_76.177536_g1941_i0.p1  ORF type:complete len:178 (-),score=34.81 NODE_1991_length_679_cov_76.177536_g1941_i0:73-606(-)